MIPLFPFLLLLFVRELLYRPMNSIPFIPKSITTFFPNREMWSFLPTHSRRDDIVGADRYVRFCRSRENEQERDIETREKVTNREISQGQITILATKNFDLRRKIELRDEIFSSQSSKNIVSQAQKIYFYSHFS